MMNLELQFFGGRGAGSSANNSLSSGSSNVIKGGSVTGDFVETSNGRYSSTKTAITAVGGGASAQDPQFEIVKGEYKGKTIYRAYENMLNHREFLFRSDSVDGAVKKLNK